MAEVNDSLIVANDSLIVATGPIRAGLSSRAESKTEPAVSK